MKSTSRGFRFIHASDTHLGSILHTSFKSLPKIDRLIKNAVYDAFRRICDAAIEYKADFIIISGDIYDRELITVKGSRLLYDEGKRLGGEGIDIYIIRGNHDPLGEGSEVFILPDNVHTFPYNKPGIIEVKKDDKVIARIIGQSYKGKWERKGMVSSYNLDDDSVYNIGILHTALEPKESNYVPCSVEDLKDKDKINYWALGHIHKCRIINHEKPLIAYAGIPQGRDIGEEGIGGALLVEVKEDLSEEIKFIPTSSIIWKRVRININEYEETPVGLNDLEELFIEKREEILSEDLKAPEELESVYPIDKIVKGYIIQWSIEGRGEIDKLLRQEEDESEKYLIEKINDYFSKRNLFLYTYSILINTSKTIPNMDDLMKNNEIIKEVHNISKVYLEDKNLRSHILKNFGNIFEENKNAEDINEEKIQLEDDLIEDIIKAARELIIEKFIEKGEGA